MRDERTREKEDGRTETRDKTREERREKGGRRRETGDGRRGTGDGRRETGRESGDGNSFANFPLKVCKNFEPFCQNLAKHVFKHLIGGWNA